MTSTLESIRAATIGKKKQFKSVIHKIDGEEIELRQPSLKLRSKIYNRSLNKEGTLDLFEFTLWGTIYSTFVPGTQDLVFSEADYDSLLETPAGSFMDELSAEVMKLMNVAEDMEKNLKASGKTRKGKQSVK